MAKAKAKADPDIDDLRSSAGCLANCAYIVGALVIGLGCLSVVLGLNAMDRGGGAGIGVGLSMIAGGLLVSALASCTRSLARIVCRAVLAIEESRDLFRELKLSKQKRE